MKIVFTLLAGVLMLQAGIARGDEVTLTGAGATFPKPLYEKWASEYTKAHPGVTVGLEGIADVLVRQFNATYENIYSFYLDRPGPSAVTFECEWLVGLTEKASRNVRVGCGHYEWTFQISPVLLVTKLLITIEQMVVLAPACATDVTRSLLKLDYPWSSPGQVTSALSLEELQSVNRYITRKARS